MPMVSGLVGLACSFSACFGVVGVGAEFHGIVGLAGVVVLFGVLLGASASSASSSSVGVASSACVSGVVGFAVLVVSAVGLCLVADGHWCA